MSSQIHKCECADTGCRVHPGEKCDKVTRTRILYRIDMEDYTGTRFCIPCTDDAMESGVFSEHSHSQR